MRVNFSQEKTSAVFVALSSMEVRTRTDFFHHRYYRLNKLLLKSLGLWPFQNRRIRFVILTVLIIVGVSQIVPQIMGFVKYLYNWDILMDCAIATMFCIFCLTKLFFSTINSEKMLTLLNHIRMDWEICGQDSDVDILHKYAENGRKLTVMYTVMGYTTCVLYITQPVLPKIIDVLLKNNTKAGQFPIPIDYYHVDMQKYYFFIILHSFLYASIGYIISIACGSMFIVYVQHGCALFAILGHKLEMVGNNEISTGTKRIACGSTKPVTASHYITSCIEKHYHAIEYAELIDASYSLCFFFLVGFNMILISITGFEISTRTTKPEETIRFICCLVVALVNLYFDNYMGQVLMDHSINLLNSIFNSKWYRLPLKSQKLLLLMMIRCNVSCKLTAGQIIILSMESYAMILKTSVSYFTLLRSA